MNIDRIEVMTVLDSENWKTQMFLDTMAAQKRLMNGQKQADYPVGELENTLIQCAAIARQQGNHLDEVFEGALKVVRRAYR